MKVTVIIITRNRSKKLACCLQSLGQQTILPDEILVIDSSSDNLSKDLIAQNKKIFLKILHFFKIKHVSIPFSRNFGLKKAKFDIIAYIDDDCQAQTNWVEQILRDHKKYFKAAIIGGRVENYYPRNYWAKSSCKLITRKMNKEKFGKTDFLLTANLTIKKQFIKKHYLSFDTQLLGAEDVDLCLQVKNNGGLILYDPSLCVLHDFRDTFTGFIRQWFFYGRVDYRFYVHKKGIYLWGLIKNIPYIVKEADLAYDLILSFVISQLSWLCGIYYEYFKHIFTYAKYK